jgi:hypothetical protein
MILVRVTFQAQYGKAGEIVKLMTQDVQPDMHGRILTDLTGSFDTVVIETEVESIDQYFSDMREMFANAEESDSMRAAGALIESGHREFFTIEAEM